METQVLYLALKEGVVLHAPMVCIQDIATIYTTNATLRKKIQALPLFDFSSESHDTLGLTVFFVMQKILAHYPDLSLVNLGPAEISISYVHTRPHPFFTFLKMTFACFLLFFGGAFSIMSFHTDVGLRDTFGTLYMHLTGHAKPPVTALEISYSVGVCLGILIFFNHIGHKKITNDPTPLQVQMRQYEQNVEQTFLAASQRKERIKDV
ncbi:stage V sporulation protein AA [Lachnospiraceae bacterium XBB1006]|nr:stage V sporulation protein AA [Lachnospiraceae bacterium XBB1006]